MNGVNKGSWETYPYTRYLNIKTPSEKYVILEIADPRGCVSMGSWVMLPISKKWIDPVGVWHDSTSISFADGHAESHKWEGSDFVKWCKDAYNIDPINFIFLRDPDNEQNDFNFMLKGYAYNSLK